MVRGVARGCGTWVVVLAAAGCGSKTGAVPVGGVVKLDGQPLTSAAVSFISQEPGGRDAHGSTDATGAFRLTTFDPGDGALPGKYKVVIQPAGEGGGATPFDDPSKPAPRAAPKAPRGPKLPAKYTRIDQTVLTQDVPASGPVLLELQSH